MFLKQLSFAGYRSFGARTPATPTRVLESISSAPLIVLLGKNNSGKSTVGKLFHHVLLALSANGEDPFPMSDGFLSFGQKFREIQHGENFFSPLDLYLNLQLDDVNSASLKAQLNQRGVLDSDSPPTLSRYEFNGNNILEADLQNRGLLPDLLEAEKFRVAAGKLLDSSCRISPVRDAIEKSYSITKEEKSKIKPASNNLVAQLLLKDIELRNAVGKWMEENLEGWKVDVRQVLDVFELVVRRGGREINLSNAGQGIQQVLPIITLCFWRTLNRQNTDFLDVIEQPELHLHDAAHASIGDLLISVAQQGRGMTVVETHSEAIVLRLRRRIAEGLNHKTVKLIYVEDVGDGSRLHEIAIAEDGEVNWWPEGVFSEVFVEVKAIRQAQRKRGTDAFRHS